MSKRRLTLDEKKHRLLELFHERKEPMQLKDLEKIAPKEKEITMQSVKDVLFALVDDGAVQSDKIGAMTMFWAFPGQAMQDREQKLQTLKAEREKLESEKERLSTEMKKHNAEKNCDDSEERAALMEECSRLEQETKALQGELDKFADSDPDALQAMKQQTVVAKDAANRWTENIFAIKQWCNTKFGLEESMINRQFGIPDDFDYVE